MRKKEDAERPKRRSQAEPGNEGMLVELGSIGLRGTPRADALGDIGVPLAGLKTAGRARPYAADEDVHRTYRDRLRRAGFLTAVPPESVWR